MATRRPLVVIDGILNELPSGDSIIGVSASGVTTGVVEIDFGNFPGSNEASVTVTGQTGFTSGNVSVTVHCLESTIDHTIQDHTYLDLIATFNVTNIVNNVGFTIVGRCLGKLQGKFKIKYTWS